jgi:membrane-associated phospholipid phosphatase
MNTQGSFKKKSRSHWILFFIFVVVIIGTEPIYRNSLFNSSVSFIESIQGYNAESNAFFKVCEYISDLGNSFAFMAIILLFYNFANVYKTFVLVTVLFLSMMLVGLLKMIYASPRPFFVSPIIDIFGCEGGWGNPSGHSFASSAFYLTTWHILFDCASLRKRIKLKYISLGVTILLILMIMLSRVFVGAHSFNQILYGCLLGCSLYFFVFFVLCIRVNDSKQFLQVIEFRNLIYGLVYFSIFLFAFIIFYFNKYEDEIQKYDLIITEKCKNHAPATNKRLQDEGFMTFAVFLAHFGAVIGLKFEYFFIFGENTENWRQFNFEIDERRDDESLMTKITINKETQWNHTNSFYSITRLFIILILCAIIFMPYYFIKWEDNFVVVFIFKVIFPLNSVTFSMFFLFKIILKSVRMVNLTLYSMLQDNM